MLFEPVVGSFLTVMVIEAEIVPVKGEEVTPAMSADAQGPGPVAVTVYVPGFFGAVVVSVAWPLASATAVPMMVPLGVMVKVTVVPGQKPNNE